MDINKNNNIEELLSVYNKQGKESTGTEQTAYSTGCNPCCCFFDQDDWQDVCDGACLCNLCCG